MALLPILVAGLLLSASPPVPPPAALAVGDTLPPLQGQFLTGHRGALPDAARGRVALVALGFTHPSRLAVDAWVSRFRRDFGTDSGVTFFEVPLIDGMGRLARPFIGRGMRRSTPAELHGNVLTVYGGSASWKQRVGFERPDVAYLLVLDREGRLAWRHAGLFREEDFAPLAAEVRRLLQR